jgi:hypothetical protein
MPASINVSSVWKSVANLYVKVGTTGGPFSNGWRTVTDGYVKVGTTGGPFSNGWRRFFTSALTPSIASTVTISRNNATYPSTLTGTNFSWTNSTSLTYLFQKSSDNVNFTDIGTASSIANPSSGSSNTVTYALTLSDFPAFTSYFRFVVTAVNSTYSTSATSTSTSVSVNRPAPINTVAPTITPSSGTVGVTQFSVDSNGTWDPVDADGVYQYLWQSFDTPTYVSAPGTNNLSTYTPPSDFLTSGYLSPIRCRVTAVNPSGSTNAFSNTATVSPVAPSASNLTTTDSTATPGSPSSITVANTANTNEGKVSWTNGANATSSWVSSVTPGSSFTATDGGTLLTEQLFTITSTQASATATVNNKNNNKSVTISWDQSNAVSYSLSYTITNAGFANGTYTSTGDSTAASVSILVTLGNVSGTVRANSVTVYPLATQGGTGVTHTPATTQSTSPTDKTSSATQTGSITFTQPALAAPTFGSNVRFIGGFSGSVSNYSVSNTYAFSTSAGVISVASPPFSGTTYNFTVTGLTVGQTATVTVDVTRTGFTASSGTTTSGASTYYIIATGLGNTSPGPYIRFVVGALGAGSISINVGRSVSSGGTKTFFTERLVRTLTNGVSANLDFSSRTGTSSNWYVLDVRAYANTTATGTILASFASTSEKQGSDTSPSDVYFSSN